MVLYKCGFKKFCAGLPCLIAAALVAYITWVYVFKFMPYRYENEEWTLGRCLIELPFIYFSSMTFVFLFRTLATDPGYIDEQYKHPLNNLGHAPLDKLRLFNMKLFQQFNLYDFSAQDEEQNLVALDSEENSIELKKINTMNQEQLENKV